MQQLPQGFTLDEEKEKLPLGFTLDEPQEKAGLPPGFILDTPTPLEKPLQKPQPLSKEKIMQVTPEELKEGMYEKLWIPYPGGPPLRYPKPKKIAKNLLSGALDFWKGMGEMHKKTRFLLPGAMPTPSEITEAEGTKEGLAGKPLEGAKAVGEMGIGMVKWIGEVAGGLALNPVKFINERPFDVVLALTMGKQGKAIVEKSVSKGKLLGKEIQKIVKKSPNEVIKPEVKQQIIEKLPPEMEFDFSEAKAEGFPEGISTKEPMGIRKEIPAEIEKGIPEKIPKEPFMPEETPSMSDIVHVKEGGEMVVRRSEVEPLVGVKDITLNKLERSLQNPIRIFDDYPTLKKRIYNVWRDANDRVFHRRRDIVGPQGLSNLWKRELKNSGLNPRTSSRRIGTHFTAQDPIGRQKLIEMGIDPGNIPKLSPVEMKIAKEMRRYFDGYFQEINNARKLSGQKPLEYVEDYFTWMTNMDALSEAGLSLILDNPVTIQRHLSGVPIKYAIPRKGSKVPVHLDAIKVFNKYSNDVIGAIEMTPVISKAKALIEPMTQNESFQYRMGDNTPRLAEFLQEWSDRIAGRRSLPTSASGRMFEGLAKKLNKNISMAILSMNVRSALIQPAALRNSFVELGPKSFIQGLSDNLIKTKRNFAMKESKVLANRSMDIHISKLVDENLSGKVFGVKEKVAEAGLKYGLQLLDMETARTTWLGAYDHAIRIKKLPKKLAVEFADDLVTKTQASGQLGDIAAIQASPTGRLFTLFQTFVINDWNFLVKDVLGYKNPKSVPKGTAVKVLKYVASTVAANTLFEDVLGVRSPFPAPEKAIKYGKETGKDTKGIVGDVLTELAEQIPVIGGNIRWARPYGGMPMPAAIQTSKEFLEALNKAIIKVSPDKISKKDIEAFGKMFGVPGTSQLMKFIRRREKGVSIPKAIIGARTDVPMGTKKDMLKKKINKLKDDFRAGKIKNPEYQRKLDKLLAERRSISND